MIVLFEDEQVVDLYPVTIGKPAYTIHCGSYRLLDLAGDLAAEFGERIQAIVRPHLRDFRQAEPVSASDASGTRVFINARLVPSIEARQTLKKVIAAGRPGVVSVSDEFRPGRETAFASLARGGAQAGESELAAAVVPAEATLPAEDATAKELAAWWAKLRLPRLDAPRLPLFDYPHDIIRHHQLTLSANLEHRLAGGGFQEISDGVFAAEGAQLGEHVATNTSAGPIVLDEQTTVGPLCYLSGPAYLGPHARVIEQSALKDGVSLGHTSKVGGEVEGSVIEPYTNKQHHGFLGHSYLGSWVNLGAGSCNSDLKNTYGPVNMEYHGRKVATGMQFVGAIVGDYAKTAINTGIFTGKTIGACSMVYGFVTTNVPSFTNYARLFGQVTEATVEVMVATQARMFARRNVQQRPCDVQLLHDMYELTRHERQIAGEPLSL
jgi:UDP-N-acetylglucosamine diphosphorylase / glucose-1-phosphate thymidylyltransferase / UDP-N-acetylgalactosamine diphosphorylase / glucosamine-1-phosphate N-acetyltransferase / galactosamine-1-phosphate N-acetyltransferase